MAKNKYKSNELDPITGLPSAYMGQFGANYGKSSDSSLGTEIPNIFGNEFNEYDTNLNYIDYSKDPQNIVERNRHEQQSGLSQLGSSAVQAVTTTVGQLMQDVGYLMDFEMMSDVINGSEKEWGNWLTDAGTKLIEAGQDIAPIYQDPNKEGGANVGDWSWWMANLPSAVASAAFFLPGLGAAKVASSVMKLARLGVGAERLGVGIMGGLINRYGESAMEAGQVADEFEQMIGQPITMKEALEFKKQYGVDATTVTDPETGETYYTISPEVAKEAGAKAAANTFKANQVLAGFDIAQVMFATAPFGSVTKNLTGKVAKALGKSGAAATAKNLGSHLLNAASEGVEEGFQYVGSTESKNAELVRMGLMEESSLSEKADKYLKDGELYTSMIIGAIGGGAMGVLGRKLQNPFSKRKGEVSETDQRIANINSWAGQMKAVTNAMAKAEETGNIYDFDALKTSTFIQMATEAAKHGNLGHLTDLLERAKEDPELASTVLGVTEAADKKSFQQNVDDAIRVASNIESAFQANINKTGNWGLAQGLTAAEIIKSELGTINNKISKNIETNAASDDLFDVDVNAPANKKNIGSDYRNRVVDTTELATWKLKQLEVNNYLQKLLSEGKDENSYAVQLAKKHVEAVTTRIETLEKSLQTSKEAYTDEQFKQDQSIYKPKTSRIRTDLVRDINQRVNVESAILSNQSTIDYLNTDEGKAIFDKTRYTVKKKNAEDSVNRATTVEEVVDALKKDDTGGAQDAVNKATIPATPPTVKTVTPEQLLGDQGASQSTGKTTLTQPTKGTNEDTVDEDLPIIEDDVTRVDALLGGSPTTTPTPTPTDSSIEEAYEVFTKMSPQAKVAFAQKQAAVNGIEDPDFDAADDVLSAIDEYRRTGSPELLAGIKEALALAKNQLVPAKKPQPNGNIIDESNPVSKIADADTFNTDDGWKTFIFKGGSLIDTILGTLTLKNGNLVPHIDAEPTATFSIPANAKLSIVWDGGGKSSNLYDWNDPNSRVYYLEYTKGKKTYRIAAIPPYYAGKMRVARDGDPLSEADQTYNNSIRLIGELRKKLDAEFQQHMENGRPKQSKMVSQYSLTLSGYNAEYNSTKESNKPINNKKLSGWKRKSDNSPMAKTIQENGGFLIGIVDKNDNPNDVSLIDFKGVTETGLQGKHDKLLNKNIPLRRKLSDKYLQSTVDIDGTITVKYYRPYNEAFIKKTLGNTPTTEQIEQYLLDNGYVVEKQFLSDDISLAKTWLDSIYELEGSGSIYIASHNPMTDGEALLMRAWYVHNSELTGEAKKVVFEYINSILTSGASASEVIKSLSKVFTISNSDKETIKQLLEGKSIKNLPWGNAEQAEPTVKNIVKTVEMILGTSHIKIDKSLFNKPAGWTGKHPFIKNTSVPFNVAMQEFLSTPVNQDAPFRSIQPVIHAVPTVEIGSGKTANNNTKNPKATVSPKSTATKPVPPVTVEEVKEIHKELKDVNNTSEKSKDVHKELEDVNSTSEKSKDVQKDEVPPVKPVLFGKDNIPIGSTILSDKSGLTISKGANKNFAIFDINGDTASIAYIGDVKNENWFDGIANIENDISDTLTNKKNVITLKPGTVINVNGNWVVKTPISVLFTNSTIKDISNTIKPEINAKAVKTDEDALLEGFDADEDFGGGYIETISNETVLPKTTNAAEIKTESSYKYVESSVGKENTNVIYADAIVNTNMHGTANFKGDDAVFKLYVAPNGTTAYVYVEESKHGRVIKNPDFVDGVDLQIVGDKNSLDRVITVNPGSAELVNGKWVLKSNPKIVITSQSWLNANKVTDTTFKLRQTSETVVEGSKEELEWFAKYFPNIPVKDLEEIRQYIREVTKSGNTAWGAFTNSAVYIANNFPEGTVYHEAFHVVFNLAFNDKQRAILMAQAEGETALDKEEWLAEKFREVMLSKSDKAVGVKGVIAKWLRELKLFIRSVVNADINNLHELAYRVKRGKYKTLKPTRFDIDSVKFFKKVSDWDWFKTRRAVNAINALVVNGIIPDIRTNITNLYNKAVADENKALVAKYKELGYNKVEDLSVAELMQFWKDYKGGDKYAVYRNAYVAIVKKAQATEDPDTKKALLSLATEMFKDGNPTTLISNALATFNKANGVIMVTKTVKSGENALNDDSSEELTQERQSEVYEVNFITKPRASEISPTVKNVLRYIPKLDVNGKVIVNEFGLADFYDFDTIDQTIIKDVSGSLTPKEIIAKLRSKLDMHPEYQYVINKMETDNKFAILMHQAYNRPIMVYKMLYKIKKWVEGKLDISTNMINSGTVGVSNSLTSSWYNTFSNESPILKSDGSINVLYGNAGIRISTITKDSKGDMWAVIDNTATDTQYESVIKALNTLGVTGVTSDLLRIVVSKTKERTLQDMVKDMQSVYDDISAGRNPYTSSKAVPNVGRNPFFKAFADLVAKNSPALYEQSHMNLDGEKVYSYVIPSFVHRLMHNMTTPAEAKELVKRYTKDALFSSNVKVNDNQISEGKTNNIILDKIITVLTTITDPVQQELELQNIVQIGIVEGVREKDGDGTGYTKMFDSDLKELQLEMFHNKGNTKGTFKVVPLSDSPNMLGITMDKVSTNEGLAALVRVAQGEFERIQAIAETLKNGDKRKFISNYHTQANASTDTGYRILPMLNGKVKNSPVNNAAAVKAILEEYYNNAAKEYVAKLEEYGIVTFEEGSIKDTTLSTDIKTAYLGKEAFTEFVKEYLINFTVNVSAFTTMSIGDPAFYKEKVKNGKVIDPLVVDYFKRAKEMFSPKSNPSVDPDETYRELNIQDEEVDAPSLAEITDAVNSLVSNGTINEDTAKGIINSYSNNSVNWTDAQAFITPQFYKRTMEAHGLWTANLELVYNKIMNGKANLKDFEVFQPIKPFMFDHAYNDVHGVMVPVQNKNSEFVLFPALANANPKLKAIYDLMNSKKVDIVNYHSAVKAGLTNVVTMQEIIDNVVEEESVNSQYMANRGIQQATSEHHIDSTGKHGSQVRVIVISALDYTKDANGNFNTMYMVDGIAKSAEDIVGEYQDLIVSNLRESYNNLEKEFMTDGQLDWQKVSDILVTHAVSNMMSYDFIDALKLNPQTGKMYLPMFDPLFSDKFDSLLSAMVRNKVTSQKINQMSLIQASSVGLDETLKLVFTDNVGRQQFDKDLVESEKIITFARLQEEDSDMYDSLIKKGYTEELWNTLTEDEKNHAKKCAKV